MSEPFIYDEVTYPSMIFPYIRPDHIGAISILHGITPDEIENCRVLELGCGDGANLLSIAYTMPESHCVGFDLSEPRIEEARKCAGTIGLNNAEFHHLDLMEYEPGEFGEFDFIIAHGIYSWVPEPAREKILWIYEQSLKPNGVGLISYNTYPGWHFREMARHAMRFQTEFIDTPLEKVTNGTRFLKFLTETSKPDSLYTSVLKEQLEYLTEKMPESVFHDDLAAINQPFYFRRFFEQIENAGLRFISELEPMTSYTDDLPAFAQEALNKLWDDPIRREQYIDFIRGRFFRSTLVCRRSLRPSYRPLPESLGSMFLSSQSRAAHHESSLTDRSEVTFIAPKGQFDVDNPLVKSLLGRLGSQWPERVSFADILGFLKLRYDRTEAVDLGVDLNVLLRACVWLFSATVIEVRCFRPQISPTVSERPRVSSFARWQAGHGPGSQNNLGGVTNMHGAEIPIGNELLRKLLLLADGTRDRSELVRAIKESKKLGEQEDLETSLPDLIDSNLEILARSALLVA